MPIITVSLFTAAKGALFLSKTGAAKMLLIKLGTLVSSGASVTTVASSGLLACTAAGYYVTVRNMSKRVVEGYSKVANGLANGNFTDFTDGLYQLARSGMTATSILHDFDTFVDGMDAPYDVKSTLKKTMRSLEYQVLDTVEHKTYQLLNEVETLLRSHGYSNEEYTEELQSIYYRHTYDLPDIYGELLGRGGRIYADICDLNLRCGLRNDEYYDHYLAYCIGGWFLDNKSSLSCLRGKTQKKVAGDITDQIISFLNAYGLG